MNQYSGDDVTRALSDLKDAASAPHEEQLELRKQRLKNVKYKFLGLSKRVGANLIDQAEALDAGKRDELSGKRSELQELAKRYDLYKEEFDLTNEEMDGLEAELDRIANQFGEVDDIERN